MPLKEKRETTNRIDIFFLCISMVLVVLAGILFWKMQVSVREEQGIKENIVLVQEQKNENEQSISMLQNIIKDLKIQKELIATEITEKELTLARESVNNIEVANQQLLEQYKAVEAEIEQKQTEIETLQEQVETLKKKVEEKKKAEEEEAMEQALAQYYNTNRYTNRDYSKVVYLTFDDGPSYKTPLILDILDQYNIKATFFVTYTTYKDFVPYYKEIVERGHSIGIHTATHDYTYIYGNLENFSADFELIHNWVYEQTGVNTTLYRFPGGSVNSYNGALREQLKYFLMQNNMMYYDWNVSSGDGNSNMTAEQIYENVTTTIGKSSHPIVLMHDTKQETVDALPSVIEALIGMGYSFEKITSDVKPVWQGTR